MDYDLVAQLASLAHPQRIAIVRLLSRRHPERLPAGEIADRLSLRASTLSGYLAQLAQAGLIDAARQGTSLLYGLRRAGAETLVETLITSGFCARITPIDAPLPARKVRNVLFVCADNATRSILAEGALRARAGDRFEVFSAGISPVNGPDPQVIERLLAQGIDTDELWSKPLSVFQGADAPVMDVVITLCAQSAGHDTPDWPGHPLFAHWPPAGADPLPRLEHQLDQFCTLDFGAFRRALQTGLDQIATAPAD